MSVERYVREQFGGDPWRAVRWLRNTLAMRVREVDSLEERCKRLERAGRSLVATFDLLQPGDVEFDLEMNAFRAVLEGREP